MSTPAAKRRRLDDANRTLCKPFRSPFKSPVKDNVPSLGETARCSIPPDDSVAAQPLHAVVASISQSHSLNKKQAPLSPAAAIALNAHPDVAALLELQRSLEKQTRALKAEIDTAEQARKIELESSRKDPHREHEVDGELITLAEKWRGASRQAAEEMFGQVRDRVNRMGGPRAWREMQQRQREWREDWQRPGDDDETSAAVARDASELPGEEADVRLSLTPGALRPRLIQV